MISQGRIKKMTSKGYGFIETKEEIDFFFRYTDYDGDWRRLLSRFVAYEIVIVSFEVDTDNTRGPKAKNVKLVDGLGNHG